MKNGISKQLKNISTVILFSIVFSGSVPSALAAIIDRDDELKIISVHPTPTLELSVLGAAEAGSDGAVMLVSLEYDAKQVTSEIESLRIVNPGYQVNTARADAETGLATLSMPDFKSEWPIAVRASQIGLYINGSVTLTPAQVRHLQKLEKQGKRASEAFVLNVPVSSTFISTRVIESYRAESQVCNRIAGKNVRSVIRGLLDFTKPREIRNVQTFEDLKKQIIDRCFVLVTPPVAISNWSTLLDSSLERSKMTDPIVATFTQRANVQKRHTVSPSVVLTIQ